MHELSIAQNIVEMVENAARENKASHVSEVEIDIGMISGVVPEALSFALEVAVENTKLAKAKIQINIIPGKAKCNDCGTEFDLDDLYALCSKCAGFNFNVLQGKELSVKNITVQ